MKHLKKSFTLLMLLTSIFGSRTFAQDYFSSTEIFKAERIKEILQDNEYSSTGYEQGIFYDNPLMLNGEPLDYMKFNVKSKGELTVIKGAAITGKTTQVPFFWYLRRDGNQIPIPVNERSDTKQTKIDISEILKHAEPGDHLVIEPVNKQDGPVKRILKIPQGGC